MNHDQEIQLVRLGSTGVPIPTRDHVTLSAEATALGTGHVEALQLQTQRQLEALKPPQQLAA